LDQTILPITQKTLLKRNGHQEDRWLPENCLSEYCLFDSAQPDGLVISNLTIIGKLSFCSLSLIVQILRPAHWYAVWQIRLARPADRLPGAARTF
jgi:hypothetical protein